MTEKRLIDLFCEAVHLPRAERESFVRRVTEDDTDQGAELQRLLDQVDAVTPDGDVQSSFTERISAQYGPDADPHITLAKGDDPDPDFTSELIQRLAGREGSYGRYQLKGEVARGGQGAILRVWDEDLRRNLAMKVLLGEGEASKSGVTPEVNSRTLGRFLEEAQVTGQLEHPGVVPVHELGLDSNGRVYFTMKLVKGRDLKAIFDLVHEGKEGWTQTGALNVMLKVCEAMAYAHSKGVIHRDLKPANVMVGKFGEVFVMDWGLARVAGKEDRRDLRIQPEMTTSELHSERREASAGPDSPLITMDGDVVGTPAYMSPEQARGDLNAMGAHSDVYAAGAMLYDLLAGHIPYVPPGRSANNYAVWQWVQAGPPQPLSDVAPDAPGELTAICEKAMEREPRDRYADMGELAEDLRAFLESRVVQAYRTGAVAEFGKWVRRNRGLAATILVSLVVVVGGTTTSSLVLAKKNREIQEQNRAIQEARVSAEEERARVLGLADVRRLSDLLAEAEELWPAHPSNEEDFKDWLLRANDLTERLPAHRDHLGQVRTRIAEVKSLTESFFSDGEVTDLVIDGTNVMRTDSGLTYGWLEESLTPLVEGLEEFIDPDREVGALASVRWRLDFAHTLRQRSIMNYRDRWDRAIESIADVDECPRYGGLRIVPQVGLVPLGRDSLSGLWEFALLSVPKRPSFSDSGLPLRFTVRHGDDVALLGQENRRRVEDLAREVSRITESEVPERDPETGALIVNADTGLVFVLLPGGTYTMGAQSRDPKGANYDPRTSLQKTRQVSLSAFLISKYETTRAQWGRLTGETRTIVGALRPAQAPWEECVRIAIRFGLEVPTDEQFEYAARGGTSTPWWTGEEYESLGANPFGLHDVHESVVEWCRATGKFDSEARVTGGGVNGPMTASSHWTVQPGTAPSVGFRPARPLTD